MKLTEIAIIGGGVSGLGVAYELRRNAIKTNTPLKINIFEQHPVLGGNADTVVVDLGQWQDADHANGPYHRWADMGVNDINLTAYKRISKILKEIDYFDKDNPGLHPKLMPLENTETYFNWNSTILLSDDADLKHGVSNIEYSMSEKDKGKLVFWLDVVHEAAYAEVKKHDLEITVGNFFHDVINHPENTLQAFVGEKSIDWNDAELKRILTEIRDNIFYPRISAMYFANDYGPEKMLLAAPMCYYKIQESKGDADNKKPDRRYFVGGAVRWLKALLDNLLDPVNGCELVEIHFHKNYQAKVTVKPGSICISNERNEKNEYKFEVDRCIVTVHADDAAALLEFDQSNSDDSISFEQFREHQTAVLKLLQSISYTNSTAVCHTYAGLLPSNRNQWRSYNVLIREGVSLKPYSMTYLCNRHQNDAKGLHAREYNQVGLPQFFVTLNPLREIPDKYVLRTVHAQDVSDELKNELPQLGSAGNQHFHHSRALTGDPAVVHFKHNLLDKKCFLAQRELNKYHGHAHNLYFSGGWSNGSGLHEECWQQAEYIASQVIPA